MQVAIAILTTLGLLVLGSGVGSAQVVLKVANFGGQFTESQKKYAGDIFTARTGVKIQYIDGNPKDHLAKLIASRGREVPYDVVYLDVNVQAEALKAGLLEKLDPKIVTNLAHLYDLAKHKEGYGPLMIFLSFGIAYNTNKFQENGIPPITSWGDLWHPKLQGRIALPDITTVGGQATVIAAAWLGGGNEKNPEPGFERLSKLNVRYFFTSSAALKSRFLSGDIWVAPWYNGRAWGMIDEGFPLKFVIPKEKGIDASTTIDMVKGTKHPIEAQKYINQVLDPLAQLGQANEIPYGPTNKLLAPVLKAYPEFAQKFPASPEDVAQLYAPDWERVNESYQDWVDKWNRRVRK